VRCSSRSSRRSPRCVHRRRRTDVERRCRYRSHRPATGEPCPGLGCERPLATPMAAPDRANSERASSGRKNRCRCRRASVTIPTKQPEPLATWEMLAKVGGGIDAR
jgi:hypothetical protein